nr:type VI immunity family protein [Myxococcus sp. RHSTA-1-4]
MVSRRPGSEDTGHDGPRQADGITADAPCSLQERTCRPAALQLRVCGLLLQLRPRPDWRGTGGQEVERPPARNGPSETRPARVAAWHEGTHGRVADLPGPAPLERVGWHHGTAPRLHSRDIGVQELGEERAVVTLGAWPEAGGPGCAELPPSYREMARVLEPWLFHEMQLSGSGFTQEELRRWERCLLD